jgi:hypothetical protein
VVGRPKSEAGLRSVAIPPHIQPALEEHLAHHVARSRNALLFVTTSASTGHTGTSTRPRGSQRDPRRDAQICDSTIFATRRRCWRRKPVQRSLSSWHVSDTARRWRRFDTSTLLKGGTLRSLQHCQGSQRMS